MFYDKKFWAIFISALALSLSAAYAISAPKSSEQFLSITTLGDDLRMHNYTSDQVLVKGAEPASWNIKVYNNMGTPQYVSVRMKLLNSTEQAPNPWRETPSNSPVVVEFTKLIENKESWIIPVTWYITSLATDVENNMITIKSVNINDRPFTVESPNAADNEFRWVTELWVYDPESETFSFDWFSGNEKRSAWNQIWFRLILEN